MTGGEAASGTALSLSLGQREILRLRLRMTWRRWSWRLRSRRAEGFVVHEVALGAR